MNRILKKSFNDLRANPGRSMLVIVALVVGMWGIGSIAISYAVLQNDLNENYLKTAPAHVTIVSADFNKLDLGEFRQRPEISRAEFRDLSIERIEVYKDEWLPLWVFGVENFRDFQLARFYRAKGRKTPPSGTMLFERNGQLIADLDVGSVVRLQTTSNKVQEIPVTGIVFDPAQAPSSMDHWIYAYVDKKTFRDITGKSSNQRLLLRLNNVHSKQQVQAIAIAILNDFSKMGIKTEKITIPSFNEHPHQFQLNSLLFLQGGIGLLAFIMGMILVAQLMAAILAQQIRQIGILKAIGASNSQIFNSYLLMAAIVGLVAMLISIPLAIISGYGFTRFVAQQLNFEVLTTSLSPQFYLLLFVVGLLMPILASISAIRKGVRVSVVDALGNFGVTVKKDSTRLMKLPLSNSSILAVRNTLRRKGRLIVTTATMALGVAIFSTGFNIRQSIVDMLADIGNSLKYDVQLVLRTPLTEEQALSPFRDLRNLSHIQTWSGGKGIIQTRHVGTTNETIIVALPRNTGVVKLEVLEGRWLGASEEIEIVVNQKVLETFDDPVVGEYYGVNIKGTIYRVKLVGIVRQFALPTIYMDKDKYDDLIDPRHFVKTILFMAQDGSPEQVAELKKNIERAISRSGLKVRYVTSHAELAKVLYDHLNIILSLISFLALLVLIVGALGMASAMGINIMERTREIGVLRAVGATPAMVYRLFVTEGMIITIASIFLGLVIALPLSVLLADFFGNLILEVPLNFAFSYQGLIITLITCLSFGWLASRIPAGRATKVSVREALAYE